MKTKSTNYLFKPILLLLVLSLFYINSKAQYAYSTFTRTYTNGTDASAQCVDFNIWRAGLIRTDYTICKLRNGTTTFVCVNQGGIYTIK